MKPDWKDAPEWAQWLAQDGNGGWWRHELESYQVGCNWESQGLIDIAEPVAQRSPGPCEPRPEPPE